MNFAGTIGEDGRDNVDDTEEIQQNIIEGEEEEDFFIL